METAAQQTPGLVAYGDFNCARCYLASQRLDHLQSLGVAVTWRAVEHDPKLPVTGRRQDAHALATASDALAVLRLQLSGVESLPEHAPPVLPKTQAAVSAYAEAGAAGVAAEIRQMLFRSYWVDSANIGNPEVLRVLLASAFMRGHATSDPIREFGYAVAPNREPITGKAWHLIRDWRREWRELDRDELPALTSGARAETGGGALAWLAELLDQQRALGVVSADGGHREPMVDWRPPTTVTPPAAWTSQVGDPWSRAGRMRR